MWSLVCRDIRLPYLNINLKVVRPFPVAIKMEVKIESSFDSQKWQYLQADRGALKIYFQITKEWQNMDIEMCKKVPVASDGLCGQ